MACAVVSRTVSSFMALYPPVGSGRFSGLLPVPKLPLAKLRFRGYDFATGCKLNFGWEEADMGEIGIGIVGGGYMGKAHAVAMSPSARCLTPACGHGSKCPSPQARTSSAERYRAAYGFARAAATGRSSCRPAGRGRRHRLAAIHPPRHCRGRLRARQAGTSAKSRWAPRWTMPRHGRSAESGAANMVGFNYIRTPASRFARS
jgi:hypothetical protein